MAHGKSTVVKAISGVQVGNSFLFVSHLFAFVHHLMDLEFWYTQNKEKQKKKKKFLDCVHGGICAYASLC